MDNDGLVDLVFAIDWNITWSKNMGDNKWTTNQPIDLNYDEERKIQLADLDGDNWLDIVVVHDGNYNAWAKWYRNETDGTFSEAIVLDEVNDPSSSVRKLSVAVDDIDNDGDIDIAAAFAMANENAHVVKWYENEDGLGTFSEGIIISDDIVKPWDIKLAHLNDDEFLDIVLTSDGESLLLLENLNGTEFDSPVTIGTASIELLTIEPGDIDGDGDTDIVGGIKATSKIVWYENLDNNGSFGMESVIHQGTSNYTSIKTTDLDGDLDLDIVYVRAGADGQMGYLENLDGMGNFSSPILSDTTFDYASTTALAILDLDNDLDLDIVACGDSPEEYFMLLDEDGQGNFVFDQVLNMSPNGLNNNDKIKMADMDGDGHADVVVLSDEPYPLCWLRYNTDLELYEKPILIDAIPYSFQSYRMIIFDVNNDGRNDIIINDLGADVILSLINDGVGNFSIEASVGTALASPKFNTADLDNDGYLDIISYDESSGSNGIYWYRNLGTATGEFAAAELIYSDNAFRFIEIVDFDNDGLLDIIPIVDLTTSWNIGWIKNNGGTFSSFNSLVDMFSPFGEVAIKDMNDDGYLDMFATQTTGFAGIKYYRGIEGLMFDAPIDLESGGDIENLTIMDYDFDGFGDLVFVEDDLVYWLKKIIDENDFESSELIDLELEEVFFFDINDIDSDGDQDFIYGDFSAIYCKSSIGANGRIVTNAFYDENQNGTFDANEPTLNGFQFNLDPDDLLHYTTNYIETQFFVPEGAYTLNAYPLAGWEVTTGSTSCDIEFVQDTVIQKWFGFYPSTLYSSIQPDLSSAPTRCGFTVPFWLSYANNGTAIEDGMVSLYVEDHATFIEASPMPDSTFADTLYWFINDLAPTYSELINLEFEIDDVTAIGDTVKMSAKTFTFNDASQYEFLESYEFESEINCSYDPNDKLVMPEGFLEENYTLFGEELTYTVRFQNTGTDTAFNIVITDVLDTDLDWSTFRIIAQSHVMETTLDPQTGLVSFSFPDILLPDSTVNEIESHGFVKYAIAPKDNLPENTAIENFANIFFDFNPPIITNTTLNTFVSEYPLIITPTLENPLCAVGTSGLIELDVYGIEPLSYEWNDPNLSNAVNGNLPAGEYEVTITDATGQSTFETYTLTEPPAIAGNLSSTPQVGTTGGTATVNPTGGIPPYTIEWNTNPIQTGTTITDLAAGIYTVNILDTNGCSMMENIEVDFLSSFTSIENTFDFGVYPNPATGDFSIIISGDARDLVFEITDMSGKKVFTDQLEKSTPLLSYNREKLNLTEGIYFIGIKSPMQTLYKKIVILD